MTGITYFVALPFDVADGSVVVGEPIECPSPASRSRDALKVFGKCWATQVRSRSVVLVSPATGDFRDATMLRKVRRCAG